MPLRYNKTLRQIFKEILHMQHIGQLDAATDDKLREYLHTHRKAIRELQRAATRQVAAWTPGQLLVELSDFVQRRADKRAPPSLVDLLVNTEQKRSDEWLQQPGEHSFNDEMNGIGPEARQKMDLEPLTQRGLDVSTEQLGYKEYKCPRCRWVHAALPLSSVQAEVEAGGYSKCFRCGAPSAAFVPAQEGDVHRGATIQGVYVPGVWDDFFINGPSVSEDFDK